jgi:hypothetical protein
MNVYIARPISRQALGRTAFLGSLYDATVYEFWECKIKQQPLENKIVKIKEKECDYFRSVVFRLHMSIQAKWKKKKPSKQKDG